MDSKVKELIRVSRVRRMCSDGTLMSVRKDHHLTLRDVATALDTDVSTIQKWEHGERLPRREIALRLMDLIDALTAEQEGA